MKGILIINTGSPRTYNRSDVKWFIGEMLSDPFVIDSVPNWFRPVLAKRIIAPLRASKSAKKYKLIWNKEYNASPLVYNSQQLANKIEATTDIPTEIAMRYGYPDIPLALSRLENKCSRLHEVIIVPMFPQYAQSSYQTVVDAVAKEFYKKSYKFRLKVIKPFYNHPSYISALATSLNPYVTEEYDKLVFSFHSLPLEHVESGWNKGKEFDYVFQIKETVKLVTKELGIDPKKNRIVYSSAIGKKWLTPLLENSMKSFASEGKKKLIVITPGFPADNLESIFDIDIEARHLFLDNGGSEFHFVKGLNYEDYWVEALIKIIIS